MTHTVGECLRDTADQKWFEAGEIQGFIIPDDSTEMCFFNLISMPLQCQTTSRFLKNCENCIQHTVENSVYRRINDSARMVNFRMLPPSTTLDKAYVIRVHNDTVVYIVKGHCSANDSLYENWSPIILLQRPSLHSCDASCANCTTPTTDTCKGMY